MEFQNAEAERHSFLWPIANRAQRFAVGRGFKEQESPVGELAAILPGTPHTYLYETNAQADGRNYSKDMATEPIRPLVHPLVDQYLAACPPKIRLRLRELRDLIFEVAGSTPGVGRIEETLKWAEPAYLTSESQSGSTVRIGWRKKHPTQFAMYFHCQTNLVETFRRLFAGKLHFEGNRAIVMEQSGTIPVDSLAHCIRLALTYHCENHREYHGEKLPIPPKTRRRAKSLAELPRSTGDAGIL